MLPHKMKITDRAFNSLRRLQNNTSLTVNIGARIAFFASIERGCTYQGENMILRQRELDKYTWLGEQTIVVEMLLRERYPESSKGNLYKAWAYHVEDGALILESKQNISELAKFVAQ